MERFDFEDACIKCGICVSACPVYRVDQQFPGPKALGPDWYRRFQAGDDETMTHVSDCTFCQLCEDACPVAVPIAHLIAEHKQHAPKSARLMLRDYLLTHPQWLAMAPGLVKLPKSAGALLGVSVTTQWPSPSPVKRSYRRHGARLDKDRPAVGVFVDCFTRGFDSETLMGAIAVLERLGSAPVVLPAASHCCGAAAYASGLLREAERTADVTHRALQRAARHIEAIVTLNATCDDTLRIEWPRYFGLELSVPIVPFVEFVLDHASPGLFSQLRANHQDEVIYSHATCRSKVARGEGSLVALIEQASEQMPRILEIDCCGAAGSYAFKSEHDGVAKALGTRANEMIDGPGIILTDSGTCAIHLEELTGHRTIHPARWMATQLGHAPAYR
ncbi:MAG: 4Fe-4S dicluster domain-containing protein [Ferrimicrobium sp.]|jgi:glycerol-3-phosphate dehydrogenase subunit C|nr:4Fe-4S dicluster domain-containing protein [Ferrimicrobium sp.]